MIGKVLFLCLCSALGTSGYGVDNNPYRHREVVDPNGNYILEWLVELDRNIVTFNITCQTTGFVGFGLNRKGVMNGADVVVGGVSSNGRPYFSDRHIIGRSLEVDQSQDYTLHEARENGTHTFLSFSRAFYTCDAKNDLELQVEGDVVSILWAYGEDDDISYHFQNRGSIDAYILDPDMIPQEVDEAPPFGNYVDGHVGRVGDWNVWSLAKNGYPVPAAETSYVCTFHKAPTHNRKLHIVGFRSVLEGEIERRLIHHYLVHRCRAPRGTSANDFFGPWLGRRGEACYALFVPPTLSDIPYQHCQEVVHVWGVGGKANFFPDHVGLPLTENGEDEYFMLQMHYTNPEERSDFRVRFALEVFYTQNLRQYDSGFMLTGLAVPGAPSLMIPPSTIGHIHYGHCGSACTNQIIPKSGINIFAAFQHTHLAGRGLRAMHFRGGKELPWMLHDDNYNFNFQQIRTLHRERQLLPGDSLIVRCQYETTDRNGSVTIGGFRTTNEMCSTLIMYYPYIRTAVYGLCSSEIRDVSYGNFVGVLNTTWTDSLIENVVSTPRRNAGLTVSEVGNNIEWTQERRRRLNELQRTVPQVTVCPDQAFGGENHEFPSVFFENRPDAYTPPDVCGLGN